LCSLEAVSEEFLGVFLDLAAQRVGLLASGGGHRGQGFEDERRLVPAPPARRRREMCLL
jgi:hypothetical protein